MGAASERRGEQRQIIHGLAIGDHADRERASRIETPHRIAIGGSVQVVEAHGDRNQARFVLPLETVKHGQRQSVANPAHAGVVNDSRASPVLSGSLRQAKSRPSRWPVESPKSSA